MKILVLVNLIWTLCIFFHLLHQVVSKPIENQQIIEKSLTSPDLQLSSKTAALSATDLNTNVDTDRTAGHIILATAALAIVFAVMVAAAVCLVVTNDDTEEEGYLEMEDLRQNLISTDDCDGDVEDNEEEEEEEEEEHEEESEQELV